MVRELLGLQHRFEGARMVLAKTSSSAEEKTSKTLRRNRDSCRQDAGPRSSGTFRRHFFQFLALQRAKEGLAGAKSYLGSFAIKQIHKDPPIQDDNRFSGPSDSTQQQLDDESRHPRCLLARPSRATLSTIPGLPAGGSRLPLCSHAFRLGSGSEDLHQTHGYSGVRTTPERGVHSSVPGRPAGCLILQGRVSATHTDSLRSVGRKGVHFEPQEISAEASPSFHMAGTEMVHSLHEARSHTGDEDSATQEATELLREQGHYPQKDGEPYGLDAVCIGDRSGSKESAQSGKPCDDTLSSLETQRSTYPDSSASQRDFETLEQPPLLEAGCSASTAPTVRDNAHGRLSDGLGLPLGWRVGKRNMVGSVHEHAHKRLRIGDSSIESSSHESPTGDSHSGVLRQPSSSSLLTEMRFAVPVPKRMGFSHPAFHQEEESLLDRVVHSRSDECDRRRSLETETTADRVVVGLPLISTDSVTLSSTRGGSLRNSAEPETVRVRRSESRSPRNSEGRVFFGLEPLEDNLPLSAIVPDFEGFEPSGRLPGNSVPSSSAMASTNLVSSLGGEEQELLPPGCIPLSESWRRDCLRLILSPQKPSRVDFLQRIYSSLYSRQSAQYLTGHLRHSSANQYESIWSAWVEFVRRLNPPTVSAETVLSFCISLFERQRLAVNTILSYKSALKEPLLRGFGVDVSSQDFNFLSRSFALRRPAAPARFPAWSLNSVLNLLVTQNFAASIPLLLEKALFLTALACGPRVSELHALRRGQFISRQGHSLVLRPDPSFLAKNEDPLHRRSPIIIRALEGQENSLCPVKSLENYLEATSSSSHGPLFRNQTGGPLSKGNIRVTLARLIRKAQPQSFPRTHDLRKMAASLAFFGEMSFSEIAEFTGWSSQRVFLRHYLGEMTELRHRCVALGRSVGPSE